MTTLTSHLGPVSQLVSHHLPTQVVARIDTGDTAWLLAASALVLLMAPGLALFYAVPRARGDEPGMVIDHPPAPNCSPRPRG